MPQRCRDGFVVHWPSVLTGVPSGEKLHHDYGIGQAAPITAKALNYKRTDRAASRIRRTPPTRW